MTGEHVETIERRIEDRVDQREFEETVQLELEHHIDEHPADVEVQFKIRDGEAMTGDDEEETVVGPVLFSAIATMMAFLIFGLVFLLPGVLL